MEKMKPILFSGDMVRAILDGRKTQTRRVIKPQPDVAPVVLDLGELNGDTGKWVYAKPKDDAGDILWVRETWAKSSTTFYSYLYRADLGVNFSDKILAARMSWKPSIHMPRKAARIFLRVTGVRVERVNDISEKDAIAEGCNYGFYDDGISDYIQNYAPEEQFAALWNRINSKRGFGWDVNPYVWVYSFEVERIVTRFPRECMWYKYGYCENESLREGNNAATN